jgi:hypothetical protein
MLYRSFEMNARFAWLAFPLIALAQSSQPQPTQPTSTQQVPPPEVDRALRARVTEFLQYYVEGNFRKAFELVAEDTKDSYFNAPKSPLKTFKIGEVKYSDNFTKAEVSVDASRDNSVFGQIIPSYISEVIKFKIEDGKWVWYQIPTGDIVTPMAVTHTDLAHPGTNPTPPVLPALPTDVTPEGIRAAAQKLLGQTSVDKSEVALSLSSPSESKVVFHNGMGGPVQVRLAKFNETPGFRAVLDRENVGAGETATLTVRYDPVEAKPTASSLDLRLVVSPTSQAFPLTVRFR